MSNSKPLTDFQMVDGEEPIYYGVKQLRLLPIEEKYSRKTEDVIDIINYNDMLLYVFAAEDELHYYFLPALRRPDFENGDGYRIFENWAKPVFVKMECPRCKYTFYYNEAPILRNEKYDISCDNCGIVLHKKEY